MVEQKTLEEQIEEVRNKMYDAYNHGNDYEKVLKISEKLDVLLNRLNQYR